MRAMFLALALTGCAYEVSLDPTEYYRLRIFGLTIIEVETRPRSKEED